MLNLLFIVTAWNQDLFTVLGRMPKELSSSIMSEADCSRPKFSRSPASDFTSYVEYEDFYLEVAIIY